MSNLNGEPPTDDLCFGYAMCTMEHLVQWRTVLRDGIFEHELLRPVLHGVLRHLVIQHYKGKETAAAALAVGEEHGYSAAPSVGNAFEDAEPDPEADMLIRVKEAIDGAGAVTMKAWMANIHQRMINDLADDPLTDGIYQGLSQCAMDDLAYWGTFLGNGFFDPVVLRPILDKVLHEITILGNEGNEPVRGALHIANIHGYVPSPTVTQPPTAIIEDDDPPDGRPPDLDDSAHDAFVATMPQVRLTEATLAAFEAALSASQYTAPPGPELLVSE